MMLNISNIFQEKFIINFLFALLFFSYIAGNLAINLNIIIILIVGLVFYKKDIFKIKYDFLDKLIIFVFLYILLNGVYNNYFYRINNISSDNTILIKSVLYLRFLLLYFLINFLIKKDKLNLKVFFTASSIAVIFVSLDIFYQFIFGYDIFGFEGVTRRLSGPFGDEWIAGSYIFRFGIFSFFLIPLFFKIDNKILSYSLLLILFFLFFFSLILSGNRTPFFLFLILISCILLFEKNLRKFFLLFASVVLIIISLTYNFHQQTRDHLGSYKIKVVSFFLVFSEKNILSEEELENYRNENENNMFYTLEYKGNFYKMNNTYIKEFKTGYLTWKVNKFFGGGIKSFIINCARADIPNCVNHPHNYYLEILSELGVFGLTIFIIIFLIIVFKTFIKRYFIKSNFKESYIIIPFIFLFLAEIFPIRNTGSFFSTFNATYFFLIMSVLIGLVKKQNLIEKKI
jgi:O-antigen ligase